MLKSFRFAHAIRSRLSRHQFLIGLGVVSLALSLNAKAEPHRHGVSELLMALDGKNLTLELIAPGEDIAGFENAPSTHDENERYAKIVAVLKSAGKMFSLSKEATCRIGDVHILEQLSDEGETTHTEDEHEEHDEHDEHDETTKDEAHHDNEAHGEFRVRYFYTCDDPLELTTIEVIAFERFDAMQVIELTFIGPRGQAVRRLTRQKPATKL